jgi:uncharacterized protein (DUF2249 family)
MSDITITLDVREDIRAGREPFSKIMATVARLEAGTKLVLITPFEPKPLFHVLAKQGFRHDCQRTVTGDWQVLFSRTEEIPGTTQAAAVSSLGCGSSLTHPVEVIELDARGLEPPQPLVTILEAVTTLSSSAMLRARTDRRPMHLYAQLEERGFAGESQEQADGSFITHIRHR